MGPAPAPRASGSAGFIGPHLSSRPAAPTSEHTLFKQIVDRTKTSLPEGTFAVGLGLLVASGAAYAVVIVVNAAVGNRGYAGFGVFWSLIFIVGPGVFLPLEQEVARAISHRNTEGVGSRPLVVRAAVVGGIAALVIAAVALGLSSVIIHSLFHGSTLLLVGFLMSLFGFYVMHLTRGVLSGNGRFVPYGVMVGADGTVRLVLVVALAVGGVKTVGPFGIAMGIAPFVATLALLLDRHGLLSTGPQAMWSELSTALGLLLAGSVLAQTLAYLALLVTNVVEGGSGGHHIVARSFTNAFFVARIPVLMFMAVQAALLPKLAKLAAADRQFDFRAALKRLLVVVVGVAVLGTFLAWTLGPFVGKILFSKEKFRISNTDLGMLAAGSGAFIIGLTITQALIALKAYGRVVAGWATGCVGFLLVIAVLDVHTTLLVSIAFLVGSAAATALMAVMLTNRMRGELPDATEALADIIEHESLEI